MDGVVVTRFENSKSRCPYCDTLLDSHISTDGESVPENGDFVVCGYCSGICIFEDAENNILRKATDEEFEEAKEEFSKLQEKLQKIRKESEN